MSLTNLDSMPPESHSITAEPTSSNGQGVANTTGATGFNQCPLEICRDILDYLSYDLAILKNCSLTCRTWYLIVHERLFSVCDLSKMVPKRKERHPFYYPFLVENPDIPASCYSFLVENPDIAACARVLRVPRIDGLVKYLPLLVNVQEVIVDLWKWSDEWRLNDGKEGRRDVQLSFPLVKSLNLWFFCHSDMETIQSTFPGLSTFTLKYSTAHQPVESSEVETVRGLRVDKLILDVNYQSGLNWIIRAVKFSGLYLTVGIQHADTARWVTVFLQGALFVMESLTLKFGPLGRHNDIPNEIAAAFASLDASHDTRVRCLTLRFYDQREDGFHAGDGILDTRSPLLSNFSSSILEKIELSYELALYYAEFVVNEIAPIEEHLIRLVRERREPGCRLEVVVKLKQHICFVNSDLVSVSEEQYEQRKNTVDKFGDALKRLRACRPGGRLQLENHSSDQVIALIMRVRFE